MRVCVCVFIKWVICVCTTGWGGRGRCWRGGGGQGVAMSRADCLGQEATFCSEPAVMRLSQPKVVKVIIGAGDFALLRFVCPLCPESHAEPPLHIPPFGHLFLMNLVKSCAWPSLLRLLHDSTCRSAPLTYNTSIFYMLRPFHPYLSHHIYILACWNLHQCNAC